MAAAPSAPSTHSTPAQSAPAAALRSAGDGLSPEQRRSLVWELHCRGLRSPEIAAQTSVPERTVRQWIASIREDVLADLGETRKEVFVSALESLRHVLNAAWTGFDGERNVDELYERAAFVDMHAGLTASLSSPQDDPPLQRRSNAPRYLALAMQAQREINRILGLHTAPYESEIPARTAMPDASSLPSGDPPIPTSQGASTPAATRNTSEIPAKTAISPARPPSPLTAPTDPTRPDAAAPANPVAPSPTTRAATAHAEVGATRSPRPLPKHQAQPPRTRRARQRLTAARLLKPHAPPSSSR